MHLQNQQFSRFAPIVMVFFIVFVLFLIGGISALLLVGTVLCVLFLPGFSVLQVTVSGEFTFLERLILSPIIGIAFTSLIALYLSLLTIAINQQTIILSILILSVPLLVYSWKRRGLGRRSLKWPTISSNSFILLLLMTFSLVLISFPLPNNGILIPMGDDPVTSTLAATMIVQQGEIPQSWAPYFPEQSQFTYPSGYPSIIAFLYLLNSSSPIPVLVSLFSMFFAVIHGQIFVLTRRVLNDHRIALCSAAFSALFSIGFYQMIDAGRFPGLVGVALTLNLLLFSYLYSITGKRKLLVLAGITLASLFITYTVSFITAALFVILFFSFGFAFFKHRKASLFGLAAIIIIGFVLSSPWILNIFNRLMVQVPTREYATLVEWFDLYSVRNEFGLTNLFMYYGYWLFLFGITSAFVVLVRKRIGSFLLAWFLSIFLLMLNEIFKIQFIGWYYLQSGAFLNPMLSFPLVVLSGVGFVKTYDFLKGRLENSSYRHMKDSLHFMLIITLLFAFALGATAIVLCKPAVKNSFLNIIQTNRISTADYNAIMWVSNNTPEDAVVFNDHWVGTPSTWIPTISHRRIVMPLLSISEVGWSNIMFTRQDESIIVATDPTSTEALSILEKYDVLYIFLSNRVSDQVEEWRSNYDVGLFLQSPHYELVFNEDDAWVIKVIY